ncbi:hypothetical protein CcaverHIS019_0302450 [Cutaneotrichosporon cavernicola]|uniref:Uncharacterized protein n=1 Tax=Cutaneotrichosporon cavernicola TaxID=279322 RepID=A0AA48I998_9TREE|nr:hypothetical protein CcaverHIS019_0302450 [Cutaneotrichosporon cavernicola]
MDFDVVPLAAAL